MNTNILTKDGSVSAYGFACGYVEREEFGHNKKELYKEGNVYHVRMFRGSERVIWLSYDNLSTARKDYKNTDLT